MLIHKYFSADCTVNDGERAVVAKITTGCVDRDGEVVVPQGVNTRDFEKNPVVLFNHDYYKLPIGKCVSIRRDGDSIVAKTVFAERPASLPADKEWEPDTIFDLYKQGVLNAFSIGFMPIEQRPATKGDFDRYGDGCRRVFSKSQMLEYSCVPVPANPEAVRMAFSKGLISETVAKSIFGLEKAEDGGVGQDANQPQVDPAEAVNKSIVAFGVVRQACKGLGIVCRNINEALNQNPVQVTNQDVAFEQAAKAMLDACGGVTQAVGIIPAETKSEGLGVAAVDTVTDLHECSTITIACAGASGAVGECDTTPAEVKASCQKIQAACKALTDAITACTDACAKYVPQVEQSKNPQPITAQPIKYAFFRLEPEDKSGEMKALIEQEAKVAIAKARGRVYMLAV